MLFWLGVTLADHTAEGDLVQLARSGALQYFSRSLQHRNAQGGIPQDRDCLTAASTGGVETSRVFRENVECFRETVYVVTTVAIEALLKLGSRSPSSSVPEGKGKIARYLVFHIKEPVSRNLFHRTFVI